MNWTIHSPAGAVVRCPKCATGITVQSGETELHGQEESAALGGAAARPLQTGSEPQGILVVCPDCGKAISPQAAACPQCGRPMKKSQRASAGIEKLITSILFILGTLLVVIPMMDNRPGTLQWPLPVGILMLLIAIPWGLTLRSK